MILRNSILFNDLIKGTLIFFKATRKSQKQDLFIKNNILILKILIKLV